jgi:hypothetical protein
VMTHRNVFRCHCTYSTFYIVVIAVVAPSRSYFSVYTITSLTIFNKHSKTLRLLYPSVPQFP